MSLEVIEPPSKEVLEKVRSEFGLNERGVGEAVQLLKDWIQLQPHLPKEIDDGRLERWLIRCKNSVEKVKQTLELHYTLKTSVPELMSGWDTNSNWFQNISNVVSAVPMPRLTTDYDRVVVFRLLTSDTTHYDVLNLLKLFQMVMEVRISEDYCRSDIQIYDMYSAKLEHVTSFTPSLLKKYERCAISGYNTRIKSIHVLNAPPYADILINMFKAAMKSKIAKRIQVHGSDLKSLQKQIPKEVLPTEYGGEAGTIRENWDCWKKKLESYHDIFLEREKQRSDESKRPGDSVSNSDLLGFEGSFRKLDVD